MPNTTQDKLLETFLALATPQRADQESLRKASSEIASSMTVAAAQAAELRNEQRQAAAVQADKANTSVGTSTLASAVSAIIGSPLVSAVQSGGGVGSTLGSVASSIFKSGLGLSPLVSGLFGLFGGGHDTEPPPLVKYALPASIDFQAAYSGGALSQVDYGQFGMSRSASIPRTVGAGANSRDAVADSSGTAQTQHQITVNVQAMDARSFLDRSNDIARAVRDAMLNLNAINDVVSDL
jgi:hypothetical protein